MKALRTTLVFILFSLFSYSQQNDTLQMTLREIADTVFANIDTSYIPTQRLYNRNVFEYDQSVVSHFKPGSVDTANPDMFYGALLEIRNMYKDTNDFVRPYQVFDSATHMFAYNEFEHSEIVMPLGLIDMEYNYIDEDSVLNNGILELDGLQFNNISGQNPCKTERVQMVASMHDFISENVMYFLIKDEWIFSDRKDSIKSIQILQGDQWVEVPIGQKFEYYPSSTAVQNLKFKVLYDNKDGFISQSVFRTPDQYLGDPAQQKSWFDCDDTDKETNGTVHKLEWCLLYGCNSDFEVVDKPFLLVTGYRPARLPQSFKKTFKLYSVWHDEYLEKLRQNDFDIYLIRFNMYVHYLSQGIEEEADLLVDFINKVNTEKFCTPNNCYENVIQGSSMGADVVRLALMKMEQAHFNNGADHHHTRLFISYDANYYGANLPLSYQYQTYSFMNHIGVGSPHIAFIMHQALAQKSTQQLLTYHAKGNHYNFPTSPFVNLDIEPKAHSERDQILSVMDSYDNGNHIVQLPDATRNIAVSLGKYKEKNSVLNNLEFKPAGSLWNLTGMPTLQEVKTAKYTSGYYNIFKRIGVVSANGLNFYFINQKMNVTNMQEIDNAAGSYLDGLGNFVVLGDVAYFGYSSDALEAPFGHTIFATHKPVLSALAINKDRWPADGSMTLDLQDEGLMYNSQQDVIDDEPSNYYGYPNLGHPGNHESITPFEAIYVDEEVDPHVNMEESLDPNIEATTGFLLNEIEPWYLGLQNQNFGGQARSNYDYYGKYRAKHVIEVGKNVTAKTDIGPFTIAPNAYLVLRAGDDIILEDGFESEFGARFDAMSGSDRYDECNNFKSVANNGDEDSPTLDNFQSPTFDQENEKPYLSETYEKIEQSKIRLYPNPGVATFTLESLGQDRIVACILYDLTGKEVFKRQFAPTRMLKIEHQLPQGTYIVKIQCDQQCSWTQKLIVL